MTTEDFKLTMSPTIGKLAEALAKAQAEMRPALRDATNPHFKNRYATLSACFEAIRPLLAHGIAVVQPPVPHGVDGVCVATILLHSSGEWLRGDLYMPASKKDAQGFGSALSYARRYCLQATVGLATDDDDGEGAIRGGNQDLTVPLAASVADGWDKWEARQAEMLRAATTMGELQEAWYDVFERARKTDAPALTMKRLAAAKDAAKAALPGGTNGKAAHP